jgi:hypothetical protein
MAVTNAQGSVIYWSTTTVLSTVISISNVIGYNGPSGSAPIIDATHLASTAKEKVMGLADEGQIALDMFYDPADTGQTRLRECRASRVKGHWAVKILQSTTQRYQLDGKGYCTGFAIAGSVDQMVKVTATIEITGAVSLTTVATA